MEKTIYLDMDGTVADLYGSKDWLMKLQSGEDAFSNLAPLGNFGKIIIYLEILKNAGWNIDILTWLPMNASEAYQERCTVYKKVWLHDFMLGCYNDAYFLPYGSPKQNYTRQHDGIHILFDDNEEVRQEWEESRIGKAFEAKDLERNLFTLVQVETMNKRG